jgi:hypothetical protein
MGDVAKRGCIVTLPLFSRADVLDVSVACQALLLRILSAREQLRRVDTLLA